MESIDDYLNRFRQLKARCFTQIPEHELVRMAIAGIKFLIRKWLLYQQIKDIAQLADKIQRIEKSKFEKERNKKFYKFPKKDKVSFADVNYNNTIDKLEMIQDYDVLFEGSEINLAKLKPGPPYTCNC